MVGPWDLRGNNGEVRWGSERSLQGWTFGPPTHLASPPLALLVVFFCRPIYVGPDESPVANKLWRDETEYIPNSNLLNASVVYGRGIRTLTTQQDYRKERWELIIRRECLRVRQWALMWPRLRRVHFRAHAQRRVWFIRLGQSPTTKECEM